jgi:hypothetical protein
MKLKSILYTIAAIAILAAMLIRFPDSEEIKVDYTTPVVNVVADSLHVPGCEHGYTIKDHFPCSN